MSGEPTFDPPPAALEAARRAAPLELCRECRGRLFGRLGHGLSNPERADRIARLLDREPPLPTPTCAVCSGAFARLAVWVERVERAAAGYEWHRFTCGSRWDPELLAREEATWAEVRTEWGESVRTAFNRELGKKVSERTGATGGSEGGDVVFVADLPVGRVDLTVLPLYFRGRYRKLDRAIPQTRWPCRRCRGLGCARCGGTGRMYATSVEELVAAPFLRVTQGEGSRFHGMGREDIDARMLGRGRPFVLEVLRPRRRTVDLREVVGELAAEAGGRVEVLELREVDSREVIRVKEATPEKSYRVEVLGATSVAKVNEALTVAVGRAIAQRTPTRVAHRRSDRVRSRRIVAARVADASEGRFTLELRTEAGTYVKEWVEGDEGRTEPSLAGLVGVPLKVEALDVLEIHDTEG